MDIIRRIVQGWLKGTRNSYLNTVSFLRNHIWMCGVLKKSIFAYLKFHICIPKILHLHTTAYFDLEILSKGKHHYCEGQYFMLSPSLSPLPKFQRPRISESKVFPCLQCVSSFLEKVMRHWQLIRSKLGFYFSSGITLDICVFFLWRTPYWSIEDKTYKKVERNPF